ncbi:hypothetical protein I6F11_23375 [Ensifer sp. NBAIM29]|nr:hypothetical protein [Ensifer sp. NBAIM29]
MKMIGENFTLTEFAHMCGCTKQALYKAWKEDRGPPYFTRNIGGRPERLIPADAGLAWAVEHFPARGYVATRLFEIWSEQRDDYYNGRLVLPDGMAPVAEDF